MSTFNSCTILGNLGKDPELKTTANSTVANITVATQEYAGEGKEPTTEWHRIVVWGKQAESLAKFRGKGDAVLVTGRLATRSWDDKETGTKKFVTEIIAKEVKFVGPSKTKAQGASTATTNQVANGGATPNVSTTVPEYNLDQIPF